MIQYIRLKHTKHTGNTIREYLSISDGVMPNNLFISCVFICCWWTKEEKIEKIEGKNKKMDLTMNRYGRVINKTIDNIDRTIEKQTENHVRTKRREMFNSNAINSKVPQHREMENICCMLLAPFRVLLLFVDANFFLFYSHPQFFFHGSVWHFVYRWYSFEWMFSGAYGIWLAQSNFHLFFNPIICV